MQLSSSQNPHGFVPTGALEHSSPWLQLQKDHNICPPTWSCINLCCIFYPQNKHRTRSFAAYFWTGSRKPGTFHNCWESAHSLVWAYPREYHRPAGAVLQKVTRLDRLIQPAIDLLACIWYGYVSHTEPGSHSIAKPGHGYLGIVDDI